MIQKQVDTLLSASIFKQMFLALFLSCICFPPNLLFAADSPLSISEQNRAAAKAAFARAIESMRTKPKDDTNAARQQNLLWKQAFTLDPSVAKFALVAAKSCEELHDFTEAHEIYRKALKFHPNHDMLLRGALQSSLRLRKKEEVVSYSSRILHLIDDKTIPDENNLVKGILFAYLNMGLDTEAIALARQKTAAWKNDKCAWILLSKVFEKDFEPTKEPVARRRKLALAAYQISSTIKDAKKVQLAAFISAYLSYLDEKRIDDAYAFYATKAKSAPYDRILIQILLLGLKKDRAIYPVFHDHFVRTPTGMSPLFLKALFLDQTGKPNEALTAFNQFRAEAPWKKSPPPLVYYVLRSEIEQSIGDGNACLKTLREGVAQYPHNASLANSLAYTLACAAQSLDEADRLITYALHKEPENEAYLDTKAWILFKENRPHEALQYALRAVEKDPDNDEICSHFCDLLRTIGKYKEAQWVIRHRKGN